MVPAMIESPSSQEPSTDTPVSAPMPRGLSTRDARLRKHADYQRVYKAARKQFSPSMTWFLAGREPVPQGDVLSGTPRVGLTAGKVLGKAHERNRIKRRMRELVRRHLHELPAGVDLILHPRRSVMTMDFGKLDAEILRIFRQAAAQARQSPPRVAAGLASAVRPISV
jgi:ribonuclease P protein component